jgi:hypothetical protein
VFQQTILFASGTEGYHTFRIPSLLAFCEGRKNGRGDSDLLLRRSASSILGPRPIRAGPCWAMAPWPACTSAARNIPTRLWLWPASLWTG